MLSLNNHLDSAKRSGYFQGHTFDFATNTPGYSFTAEDTTSSPKVKLPPADHK